MILHRQWTVVVNPALDGPPPENTTRPANAPPPVPRHCGERGVQAIAKAAAEASLPKGSPSAG
jgi:hypothetical protein